MSAPTPKKQKFQYKIKYPTKKKQYLQVGLKGFLASCNFNEIDCVRECYNILNEYSNELYGIEEYFNKKKLCQNIEQIDQESLNEDIADELEKQINASKEKLKSTANQRRFQVVDTGAANLLFIKTTLDDPIAITNLIVRDIAETKKQKTRYLLRLVPIEAVCKANHEDIVNSAGLLCDKYFLEEPTTFAIVYNKRLNNDIRRDPLIRELADLIHVKHVNNKVDLKHAKKTLLVEVIKGLCCLSVVENYFEMKKYNLFELAKSDEENAKEDIEEVDKEKSAIQIIEKECIQKESAQENENK